MKQLGVLLAVVYLLILAAVVAVTPSLRRKLAEWWGELAGAR